jgi:hypothetical protein
VRKYLQNDKGYSLLLAIGSILIFTVLGLSLMTLTTSGITKNSHREDTILAQDLSEKGIDFAVNDIQNTLEKQIVATPMGKTEFGTFLDTTLNKTILKCPPVGQPIPNNIGFHIPAENNNITKVCIETIKMMTNSSGITEEKDRYKRLVTFRSYGVVKNKEHISKTDVIIGTDAIPDQLKYAISSNNDGSLYFHGGVEVTGDIKSSADIHIIKKAFSGWSYDPTWHKSIALKMNPTSGSASSKIILSKPSKKLYYYDGSQFREGQTINYKSPTNIYTINNQKEVREILTLSNKVNLLSKDLPEDTIDVETKVTSIYTEKKYTSSLIGKEIEGSSDDLKRSPNSVTMIYNNCVSYSYRECTKKGFGETNLNITGTTNSRKNVDIQGTYYIKGDVTINYANIKSNAILYVDGNVNIRFSTLRELQAGSSLIIFASGSIFIANISEYLDSPSIIKGFFYSQNDMTLYGVGSNIKVIGGLSAKNIYLTALRGSVSKNNLNVPESTQLVSNSRLQIIYDENIIKQFTEFKRDEEEEFITQLNAPETIKRY